MAHSFFAASRLLPFNHLIHKLLISFFVFPCNNNNNSSSSSISSSFYSLSIFVFTIFPCLCIRHSWNGLALKQRSSLAECWLPKKWLCQRTIKRGKGKLKGGFAVGEPIFYNCVFACPCYLPVWPDLAKFHHFGQYLKIFGKIFKVYLVLGKGFCSLWYNLYAFGQIFSAEIGQYLKHNLVVWSHCYLPTFLQQTCRYKLNSTNPKWNLMN